MEITKIDSEELSSKALKILLDLLKKGKFDESGKLPPEEELAKMLGISRTVLRDTLTMLEHQGFITRRRGVGTLVNKHIINLVSRLDVEKEFLEEISDAGYSPSVGFVNVKTAPASEEASKHLMIEPGEELIVVEKLLLANDKPAIYCLDHFAKRIIGSPDFDEKELRRPIFDFLKSHCQIKIETDITKIFPIVADEQISKFLDLSVGSPLLHLNETGYDIKGKPVLWSKEYYSPNIFSFTVLRRKI